MMDGRTTARYNAAEWATTTVIRLGRVAELVRGARKQLF